MMFFVQQGHQVIAHDRRGHGRFPQGLNGHDMDTYMPGVVELTDSLDLHEAVHIGHSTGSGEVARYVARAKPDISGERMPIRRSKPCIEQVGTSRAGLSYKVPARSSIVGRRRRGSSSALAKYALALRSISLAWRTSVEPKSSSCQNHDGAIDGFGDF